MITQNWKREQSLQVMNHSEKAVQLNYKKHFK